VVGEVFSIKDIEILDKFAGKIYVPLFAAACIIQPPIDLPDYFLGPGTAIKILSLIVWLLLTVTLLWLFHDVISYLDAYWLKGSLFPFLGWLFLSFGVLALCKLGGRDPFSSLSVFWNLAFLAYGLLLLQIVDRVKKAA
jgi:hypothetical protein